MLNESALRPAHLEALDVLIHATPSGAIILSQMAIGRVVAAASLDQHGLLYRDGLFRKLAAGS